MKWFILAVVVVVVLAIVVRELRLAKRQRAARGAARSSSWIGPTNSTNASSNASDTSLTFTETTVPLSPETKELCDAIDLDSARVADVKNGSLRCEGCGCTDLYGCPGGCYWVSTDPPRCSRCVADGDPPAQTEPEPREKPARRDPAARPSRDVVLAALRKACEGSPKKWVLARELAVAIEADTEGPDGSLVAIVDSRDVGTVLVQLRGAGQARSKKDRNTMLWRPVAARKARA